MPGITATATATPLPSFGRTHTCRAAAVLAPAAADLRVLLVGRLGIRLETIPPLAAGLPATRMVGVKRSAVFGTRSTLLRCMAVMVAVAVIPGRRLRSALSTSRQVR